MSLRVGGTKARAVAPSPSTRKALEEADKTPTKPTEINVNQKAADPDEDSPVMHLTYRQQLALVLKQSADPNATDIEVPATTEAKPPKKKGGRAPRKVCHVCKTAGRLDIVENPSESDSSEDNIRTQSQFIPYNLALEDAVPSRRRREEPKEVPKRMVFIHQQCAQWLPDLYFDREGELVPRKAGCRPVHDAAAAVCGICNLEGGGIKCRKCNKVSYHYACAKSSRAHMKVLSGGLRPQVEYALNCLNCRPVTGAAAFVTPRKPQQVPVPEPTMVEPEPKAVDPPTSETKTTAAKSTSGKKKTVPAPTSSPKAKKGAKAVAKAQPASPAKAAGATTPSRRSARGSDKAKGQKQSVESITEKENVVVVDENVNTSESVKSASPASSTDSVTTAGTTVVDQDVTMVDVMDNSKPPPPTTTETVRAASTTVPTTTAPAPAAAPPAPSKAKAKSTATTTTTTAAGKKTGASKKTTANSSTAAKKTVSPKKAATASSKNAPKMPKSALSSTSKTSGEGASTNTAAGKKSGGSTKRVAIADPKADDVNGVAAALLSSRAAATNKSKTSASVAGQKRKSVFDLEEGESDVAEPIEVGPDGYTFILADQVLLGQLVADAEEAQDVRFLTGDPSRFRLSPKATEWWFGMCNTSEIDPELPSGHPVHGCRRHDGRVVLLDVLGIRGSNESPDGMLCVDRRGCLLWYRGDQVRFQIHAFLKEMQAMFDDARARHMKRQRLAANKA